MSVTVFVEMTSHDDITSTVRKHYPNVQAVYLFGSYGTERQWPNSDVDVALLLPAEEAWNAQPLALSPCRFALEARLRRPVDLINLRHVSTVFQNEITNTGRGLVAPDAEAMHAFEMRVLSAYQKLNEERREILEEFFRSKRAYEL
ncbi:MAG: nucleotidyltransferase domain-containing protein [Trueperaceae bacterium]|nr:nucleotidyltransferase domain-containing protein [Trueperaceae bacterium]